MMLGRVKASEARGIKHSRAAPNIPHRNQQELLSERKSLMQVKEVVNVKHPEDTRLAELRLAVNHCFGGHSDSSLKCCVQK